jgi:hypothetical protein
MKAYMGIVSLVLVLMAASSLVSMFSILRIDSIVHGELYNYGLQFSYRWAVPYWAMTTVVFAVGWFNILTSIAFQFYVLIYGQKETVQPKIPKEPAPVSLKEVVPEAETKPPEKIEETVETPQEQAISPTIEPEPETTEEAPEKTPPTEVTETPSQQEEPSQPAVVEAEAEEQEPSEQTQTEETKTETQETSPPTSYETEQQTTPEKSEEPPAPLAEPIEEQPQTTTDENPPPQPTGTS